VKRIHIRDALWIPLWFIHSGILAGSFYTFQQDTSVIQQDTVYQSTTRPTFDPSYRFGDPISNREPKSALQLDDPSNVDYDIEYDSGFSYSVYERVGETDFRPPTVMSFQEYDAYHNQQIINDYWKEQSLGLDGESAVSGRRLIPKLYISPVFDRIFGGSYVDIQPTGFVNLDFGGLFQFIDNPQVPERQRRNGGFNFNMQISSNVVGKIGDKLAVTFNFDNNNTFDFQNDMKIEYTGYEEEIIKKIEIGNVSMPVSNSLISGAQSLFGVKTQLQFGKLFVTGIASRQRGRNDVISIENGVDEQQFEIRASNYDENRHFFLGHFFRENYEAWLSGLPQVISGVNITRIDVYVLNRNNNTEDTRNFLAFMDLGESDRVSGIFGIIISV
jgi:cell surface protein SprA